jgi:hypothetical protein
MCEQEYEEKVSELGELQIQIENLQSELEDLISSKQDLIYEISPF